MKLHQIFKKKSFSNGLKRKPEVELERPSKIINRSILNNLEVTQTFTSTDINNIYQCLYRSRRSSYHKPPTNLNEVINGMSGSQIKTVQDENFILVIDSDNKIICFSTKSNFKLLCNKEKANPQNPKESTTILTAKELSQNDEFEEKNQTNTNSRLPIH